MEVLGIIYDDCPVTTSSKSQMFSSSEFIPSSNKTPNIYITYILPRRYTRLTPKSSMMISPHNEDTPITTNSAYNKKSNNKPLNNNSGISSPDHVTNNIGILSLDHVSEK